MFSKRLLLTLILLVPQKLIFLNIVLLALVVSLFALKITKRTNIYFQVLFACMIFIFIGIGLRFVVFFQPDGRDLFELGRFVPCLFVFLTIDYWKSFKLDDFVVSFFTFLLIDGVVSGLQLAGLSPQLIETIYNSPVHVENALLIARRAIGLAPGPGQHGAILFPIYVVMLVNIFIGKRYFWLSLFGLFLSLALILATQSQTTLIVVFFVTMLALFVFSLRARGPSRAVSTCLIAGILLAIGHLIYLIQTRFPYLATLFTSGLNRSSYSNRQEKWFELWNDAKSEPFLLVFGWGKEFFGKVSSAMDSEWLYVLLVYGGIVFTVSFGGLLLYLLRGTFGYLFRKNSLQSFQLCLWLICFGGLVFGYPSVFFTQPTIAVILSVLICCTHWERINSPNLKSS